MQKAYAVAKVPICYSSPIMRDDELNHLRQEKQALQATNRALRDWHPPLSHKHSPLCWVLPPASGRVGSEAQRSTGPGTCPPQNEIGMRVDRRGWGVHIRATEHLTQDGANASQGREGLDAIGITPQFTVISMHYALPSYQGERKVSSTT